MLAYSRELLATGRRGQEILAHGPLPVAGERGGALRPGEVVEGYIVQRLSSAGGFSAVYRVWHPGSRRTAALKVLHQELWGSAVETGRFEQEVRVLQRVQHPALVELLGHGRLQDGRPYLLLEWLEGRPLSEELERRSPFSMGEALAISDELAGALAALHQAGVVHRDVKAANVMYGAGAASPQVKLIDFGLAQLLTPRARGSAGPDAGEAVVGTPDSMAPEQILNLPVDARTDVYALGVLLYQMVTGQSPFSARTASEMLRMHLELRPPLASWTAPVSRQFDQVIARSLAKRREDRYPTVRALLADLRRAVRNAARSDVPGLGRRGQQDPGTQEGSSNSRRCP